MKYSLRFKLSAAFIVLTVALFVLISVFANFFLKNQFQQYILNKQEQAIAGVVASVSQQYNGFGGYWNVAGVETAGMNALDQGLIIRVYNSQNTVIWDARTHNNGMCISIIQHMSQNMASYNANFKGGYMEASHPVMVGGVQAGSVDIGYYGPYYFNDSDLAFLNSLNSLLFWAAIGSLLACLVLGAIMARNLSRPIARVIRTAGDIAGGKYHARSQEISSTREIVELTDSINSLAGSLEKQEALRKRMTSDVAHELRTPLANLQSHVEAMIDGVWEPDAERLESFRQEILRLSKMVGDLEQLTQYEGDLALHKDPMELSVIAGSVARQFEGEFKEKGIALEFEREDQFVCADRDKVRQVLINLLSNALKYTNPGGTVTVRVSGDNRDARVSVCDTGIGIAPEDLPFVFERFYRADLSRTRATGGSGIGLAIAKSIAQAHGGRITAQSEPGRGSTFTLLLPKKGC